MSALSLTIAQATAQPGLMNFLPLDSRGTLKQAFICRRPNTR